MKILQLQDYENQLEKYFELKQTVFNHQSSGVEANNRDLRIFSEYLHQSNQTEITGDSILEFIQYLKEQRRNGAGAINRKISSIRSYIKYLRFRQVEGAEELPIENLGRTREPYRGPQEALEVEEVQRILKLIDRQSVLGFRDFLFYSLLYRLVHRPNDCDTHSGNLRFACTC